MGADALSPRLLNKLGEWHKGATGDQLAEYLSWNDALAGHYLSGQWRDRPLYLDIDKSRLEGIATQVGEQIQDPQAAFVEAVRRTLIAGNSGPTFGAHIFLLELWKTGLDTEQDRLIPPPFIGLLAFFTLVADSMKSDERFRPTNYYGRLAQALGIENDQRLTEKLQRDFRKQSHRFWDALNELLINEAGRLGRPTAFAFDTRVHVGIPISQALVREDDRRHFPDLFIQHGLSPGSFPVDEMVDLLKEWIARPSVSSALRHLWQSSADARERIAAVACHELESWDGMAAQSDAQGARRIPIRLVASVHIHPRPKLYLNLRIRVDDELFGRELSLNDGAGEAACEALDSCGGAVTVAASDLGGWGEFRESDHISMPDVLIANMTLNDPAGRVKFERRAKQIVVFAFDQERQWDIEVDRASIVARHTLLVRRRLEPKVLEFVKRFARPGWKRFDTESMCGCPEGWTLIRHVSLMAVPEAPPDDDDLQPLVPTASAALAFAGGLSLPERHTWHAALPPEVSFSVDSDQPISAVLHPIYQELGNRHCDAPFGPFASSGVVTLRETDIAPGEYRVAVYELGKAGQRSQRAIASASLRLRSAETARPLDPTASLWRPVCESPGWAAISAVSGSDAPDGPIVSGGLVELESERARTSPLPPARLERAGHDEEPDEAPVQATVARSGAAPPCFESSAHHWDLGEGVADENRRRRGWCKHCDLVQWHNTKPTKRRRRSRRTREAATTSASSTPRLPQVVAEAIGEESRVDLDTMLDAISLLRKGPWASFAAIARHVNDSPLFTAELARKLAGLGHIDIELDRSTLRRNRWAVGPPVLVGLPDSDAAILVGFRSQRLLDRLQSDVEALGGTLDLERIEGVPSFACVRGLDQQDLTTVAASTSRALGFEVHAVDNVAARLLPGLPPITKLVAALPQCFLPYDGVERFNAASGRWALTEQSATPGAYRTRDLPRTYAFVPPTTNGRTEARLGTARLVKHLEAERAGVPLVAYDPERRELAVRLGAQLPGLYERVAMLCSGVPPRRFDDGTQRYAKVPPAIAAGLWARLQPTGVAI